MSNTLSQEERAKKNHLEKIKKDANEIIQKHEREIKSLQNDLLQIETEREVYFKADLAGKAHALDDQFESLEKQLQQLNNKNLSEERKIVKAATELLEELPQELSLI